MWNIDIHNHTYSQSPPKPRANVTFEERGRKEILLGRLEEKRQGNRSRKYLGEGRLEGKQYRKTEKEICYLGRGGRVREQGAQNILEGGKKGELGEKNGERKYGGGCRGGTVGAKEEMKYIPQTEGGD